MRLLDIQGQTFGKLTVIERATGPGKSVWWRCRCSCGNEAVRPSLSIRRGDASCGCGRAASAAARTLPDDQALWKRALAAYQRNAKKRNVAWDLTDDQAIQLLRQDCHYCKSPPSNITKGKREGRFILSGGIDRRDNEVGYTAGNSVPCCAICNRAKRDMPLSQFLAWAHQLCRHTPEPPFDLAEIDDRAKSRHPVIEDILGLYEV